MEVQVSSSAKQTKQRIRRDQYGFVIACAKKNSSREVNQLIMANLSSSSLDIVGIVSIKTKIVLANVD